MNPPAEIDDPSDSKPDDWVDEPRIPDPFAEKPGDWDEDAPRAHSRSKCAEANGMARK